MSAYSVRDDVKERAGQVNDLLSWDDTVLLISQGDDATRWNYFGYDLNATLARGFGGFGYGHEGDWSWDTTHMNLVDPALCAGGHAGVYNYQDRLHGGRSAPVPAGQTLHPHPHRRE